MKREFNVIIEKDSAGCLVAMNAHAFFDPTIGRWASRDPIGEKGGANIYGFVANDAVNTVDPLARIFHRPIRSVDGLAGTQIGKEQRRVLTVCRASGGEG